MESHVDNNKMETKQGVLHDVVINGSTGGDETVLMVESLNRGGAIEAQADGEKVDAGRDGAEKGHGPVDGSEEVVGVEPALDEGSPNEVGPAADPNVVMMQPGVDDKGKAAVGVNVELSNEGNPNVVSPAVDPNVVGSEQDPNVGIHSSSLNEVINEVNVNLVLGQPSYSCKYCSRTFSSTQALGGHQNAHKHEREFSKKRKSVELDLVNGSYPPPVPPPMPYGYNGYNPYNLHQSPYISSLFNRSSSFGVGMNSYALRPPFHGGVGSPFGSFSGSRPPVIAPHNFVPPQAAYPNGFANLGGFGAVPSGVGGSGSGSNINVAPPFNFFGNDFNHGGGSSTYVSDPPHLMGTAELNFLSLGRGSESGSGSAPGSGPGLGLGLELGLGPGSGSGSGSGWTRLGSGTASDEGPGDELNLDLKL